MAAYSINEEGVAALQALANSLVYETNYIVESSILLEGKVASLGDRLGIYESEVLTILGRNIQAIRGVHESVMGLSNRLNEKANEIMELFGFGTSPNSEVANPRTSGNGNDATDNRMVPNRKTPRDLGIGGTQFGFSMDSDGNMVYDSPAETNQYMYLTQGSARFDYQGTCGLCACANILRLSGVLVSEEEVIEYASKTTSPNGLFTKLCETGMNPEMNGGTSPKDRQEILRHFDIDSSLFKVAFNSDGSVSDKNIDLIAKSVSDGCGVILQVHADMLWYGLPYGINDGHAVIVTSVKKDPSGKILGFYVCDSALGNTTFYTAEKLKDSLTGAPMNITSQVIR